MKGPVILVLISVLIAAPLFADTITLKSGQTYEGEIIGKTSEYIKLKTDSEVLRIEMSTIAKIETPEGEYDVDVKARLALTPDILAKAEAAAEAEVEKITWFAAGCFLNVIGVLVASSARPSPPESHLIGKSPEYVEAFTRAYEQRAKTIQTNMAVPGCLLSTLLGCGIILLLVIKASLEQWKVNPNKDSEAGCAAPQGPQPSGP